MTSKEIAGTGKHLKSIYADTGNFVVHAMSHHNLQILLSMNTWNAIKRI